MEIIILTILPLLSWLGQYVYADKTRTLELFRNHWTCYYADWIFIPINLLFLFSIKINSTLLVWFFVFSFIFNLIIHKTWGKQNKKTGRDGYLFTKNGSALNLSGWIHFFFSTIETTIILSIFFMPITKPFIYAEFLLITVFSILMLTGSKKIHGKIQPLDLTGGLILISLVIIKFCL